jgi:phosphoribosylformimino-5-aminoimidazole carboxamide ribonucleotide (ProFAR) isomerase
MAPFQGFSSGAANVMFGGQRLLGQLASGLGAEKAGAFLQEDAARRLAQEQAKIAPVKQEFPMIAGAGELGAEVLGTLPVVKAIAAPLRAAGARRAATAVETGGLSTGRNLQGATKLARAGDLGIRVAGGAGGAGATAAVVNPDDFETGAGVGAGVAAVAPPIVSALAKSSGFLKDAFTGQLAAVKAGKISRDVAGDQIAAIRAALAAAPDDLTAAQATAGVQNNAFQALGEFAGKTDAVSRKLKQQASDDIAQLQRMAEGGNETEMRRAYEASIARLNQLTQDMRNVELGAANQAAQTINRLAPQAQQRQESMVNALRQGMPAPVPAPLSGGLIQGTVTGPARTGQSTVAAGTEAAQQAAIAAKGKPGFLSAGDRSQEWQQTSDTFAQIAGQRRAEAGFLERQIGSLKDYGLNPLDAGSITRAIDAKMTQPGLRASSTVVKVLDSIKDDIANLTAKGGGVIDAHDLYTLRKEGINERIMQILGQTDPKISAKVTRKVLGEIRPLIDKAIEDAGGTGWRDYLKTYATNMQAIDQKAMAAEAAKLFEKSPQEYVRLVRGNNPDAVEAIFGPGSYDIFKEMGSKMPTLEKLAMRVQTKGEMAEAAALGKEEFAEAVERAGRTFPRIRNTLNPKITFANLTSDQLEGMLGPKVAAKLKQGMVSGKSALEMLNTLPAVERGAVLRMLNNPSTWGKGGGAVTRAAAMPAAPTNSLAPESRKENALAP